MEPTTMLLTALVTGLSAGVTDVAQKALAEAFEAFKKRLHEKVAGKAEAETALHAVESKPESTARQALLKEELEAIEAQKDVELVELARSVLEKADPQGAAAGKYSVTITGGQGITIGDHSTVTQTFGPPAKKQDP